MQVVPVFRFLLVCSNAVLFFSCGSNAAVPGGTDADATDAADTGADAETCQCPASLGLQVEHIDHAKDMGTLWSRQGIGVPCPEPDLLIGGGCVLQPAYERIRMLAAGIGLFPDSFDSWWCRMENPTANRPVMTTYAVCLDTSAASPVPPPVECGCPAAEPLQDRVVRSTVDSSISRYSAGIVSAYCEPDAVLIGGGCVTEPFGTFADSVSLSRAGLVPAELVPGDSSGWLCGWDNPADASGRVTAMAICVTPPTRGAAPEAEPIAERIAYRTETRTVPTNSSLNNSVPCAAGETLLMGGCMVDRTGPQSDRVVLFHHGFDVANNNLNAWRCGWYNPTSTNPTATATAICLKPSTL
jgi:hypothetical protein